MRNECGIALVGGPVDVDAGAVNAEKQLRAAAVLDREVAHAVALDVLLGVREVQQLHLLPAATATAATVLLYCTVQSSSNRQM